MVPWLWLQVFLAWCRGARAAYFPVFHPWNLCILWLCRLLRVRTILTVHDGLLHLGEANALEQWCEYSCMRLADHLIFLSHYVKERTQRTIGFSAQSCVLRHGILPVRSNMPTERVLPRQPRLLFLGRLVAYKGLDLLLEAIEGLPAGSFDCLTIAGWPVRLCEMPRCTSPKVQVQSGWLSDAEVESLLRSYDILILPYKEASQSGILTLGVAAAIPMVITHVGGLPEQLSPEEAVWVEPEAASIRSGIQLLLSNAHLYAVISRRLALRAKQPGWSEIAATICALAERTA